MPVISRSQASRSGYLVPHVRCRACQELRPLPYPRVGLGYSGPGPRVARLKDESKEEIAIIAWGSRMVSAARDMKVGQLAQIDNCLLHKKLDGSVEGSYEDFLDFSHLTTDVAGERAERLRQLDCDKGHAISTPWSLQAGALRMKTDGSEKYVSCATTAL